MSERSSLNGIVEQYLEYVGARILAKLHAAKISDNECFALTDRLRNHMQTFREESDIMISEAEARSQNIQGKLFDV